MREHAAEPPAQERNRDRNEGEVVPDSRRINPRKAYFENQSRESRQKYGGPNGERQLGICHLLLAAALHNTKLRLRVAALAPRVTRLRLYLQLFSSALKQVGCRSALQQSIRDGKRLA